MLLCPNCHSEATLGAMNETEQRRHKAQPYNIQQGYAGGNLKVNQDFCGLLVGTNQFVGDGCFIKVDGEPLLSLRLGENSTLELSIALYDKYDNLLALIENNEWVTGDPIPWDIESSFQRLKIRRKTGDIALAISTRMAPIKLRADLWRKRQNIRLEDDILVNGTIVENVRFRGLCFVACHLVINTLVKTFELVPDPRYGDCKIVSWPDRAIRLEMGRIEWMNLNARNR